MFMCKRKGGNKKKQLSHNEWCQTVQSEPDVISMSFIPITSLLGGINGSGYLTHAINLYLRCKHNAIHTLVYIRLKAQFLSASPCMASLFSKIIKQSQQLKLK